MALFKRKKSTSVLPEIDQYYEGQRRDRTGTAWLLAIASVLIVALFIIVLFLAGRWAYREISGSNDTANVDNGSEGIDLPSFDGSLDDNNSDVQDDEEVEPEGAVDAPARTNTPSDQSTPSSPIPTTGDDPLPGTGPGDTLAIFLVATALATGAHHYTTVRKQKS